MTNRSRWFLAPATIFLAFFFPPLASASPLESVFISEVNWAGSEKALTDEWIELTNSSNEPVDISGWSLEGAGTNNGVVTLPVGAIISPHATYLISNYSDADEKSCIAAPASYVTTAVSLSNSNLEIILRNPDGSIRDISGNNRAPFAGSVGGTGGNISQPTASMVRRMDGIDGAAPDSWISAATRSGFDDETIARGTPGSIEPWFVPIALPEPVVVTPGEEPLTEEPTPEPVAEVSQEIPIENPTAETASNEPPQEVPVPESSQENTAESVVTETIIEPPVDLTRSDPSTIVSEETAVLTETRATEPTETMITPETTPQETPEPETLTSESTPLTLSLPSTPLTPFSPNLTYPIGTLIVNELYPRPKDDEDEWVEVCNPYNNVIPLGGWSVMDDSEHKTQLPNQYLGMGQCVVIKNPAGKLNNDGDTVTILDPSGDPIDIVAYEKSAFPKNETVALARTEDGAWQATITPTLGEQNIITPVPDPIKITKPAKPAPIKITITGSMKDAGSSPAPSDKKMTDKDTPAQMPIGPLTIRISEIYPNTAGNDADEEFIEVENWGLEPVSMKGWVMEDATGKRYAEKETVILPPLGFIAFQRRTTQIVLNNTEDTVRLYAPNGQLIDKQTYDKAPKGYSKTRVENVWDWTRDHTPDEPNIIPPPAVDSGGGSPIRGDTTAPAAKTVEKKTSKRISVSGIVVAIPEQPGSKAIILDGNTPILLSKTQGTFPLLELGDKIVTTGVWQKMDGETVFRVWVTDEFSVTGKQELPEIKTIGTFQITDADVGKILSVEGLVASRTKSAIAIEKDGHALVLDGLEPMPVIQTGDMISAIGIVRNTTNGRVITIRSPTTIEKTKLSEEAAESGKQSVKNTERHIASAMTAASILTMVGLAIKHFFF